METPSLNYLNLLSNGSKKFEEKILHILISELPMELDNYQTAVNSKNYHGAAQMVHKINYKIAFFQMEKSSTLTSMHESALREGKLNNQAEFLEIVTKILKFLPQCPK